MTSQTSGPGAAASLTALWALDTLDSPAEERFDRITRLATKVVAAKGALIIFKDSNRAWTKSSFGVDDVDQALVQSVCLHVVSEDSPLFLADLSKDERFAGVPVPAGAAPVRMYAGLPLHDQVSKVTIGTLCVLDTKASPMTDEQRSILHELAAWAEAEFNNVAVNDLSQRLMDRQQHLATLLSSLPDAVLVVDDEGSIEETNAAGRRMFGGDGTVLRSLTHRFRDVDERLLPDRRRREIDSLPLSATTPRSATAIRIDGSEFSAEVSVAALADDPLQRSLVLVRDIGILSEAAAESRRQRQQTELILSTLAEGVLRLDAAGIIRYANRAAAQLLRARVTDLLNVHFVSACQGRAGDVSEPSSEVLFQAIGGGVRPNELLRRRDGSEVVVDMALTLIREGGEVQGAVVSVVDASERHARQQREDEFVAVVSHELRTPLTSIKASLGMLSGGVLGQLSPEVHELLGIATTNIDRLARLVNDLLDFERLSSGGVPMSPTETDLGDLLENVVAQSAPAANEAGVRMKLKPAPATIAEVDRDRMTQALTNLVGNALKFSPPGTQVFLSVEQRRDQVVIKVQDHGRGIPAEKLERIFQRFGQAEAVGDTALGGTGLGLPIARSIVEAHGGLLTVDSTLGEGSTFAIVLPANPGLG